MAQMIQYGSELLRINTQKNTIEYSKDSGHRPVLLKVFIIPRMVDTIGVIAIIAIHVDPSFN